MKLGLDENDTLKQFLDDVVFVCFKRLCYLLELPFGLLVDDGLRTLGRPSVLHILSKVREVACNCN